MTVPTLLVKPAMASQTHASVPIGHVEVSSTVPVRLLHADEVESPRSHLWVGARGLRRTIRVAVTIDVDGTYVVEDLDSGIFGDGPRLSAAIEDFRAALVSHRDELLSAERLSPHLQRQLTYLNDLLG